MRTSTLNKRSLTVITVLVFLFLTTFIQTIKVSAQAQVNPFSANDPASYQCFDSNGQVLQDGGAPAVPHLNATGDGYECTVGGKTYTATIIPPTLQQTEIWFVRILYVVWALVAGLSFIFLLQLAYRYIISQGDVTKTTEIRKKILYYIVGFSLVFLAVPILTTVFNVLGINKTADCYNVNMPGFQFFFATLCTDPKGLADPCGTNPTDSLGKGCATPGSTHGCYSGSTFICFQCISDTKSTSYLTWQYGNKCQ